jgi:inorganic triphosphatase YgiF
MAPVTESSDREVEVALLVRSERAADVLDRIAGLMRLAGRSLERLPDQELCDIYLDTAAGELRSRRIALRLRRVDGVPFVTLKAPQGQAQGGADRVEIERPWSREAWDTVARELARLGVDAGAPVAWPAGPLEMLESAGLRPLQRRHTNRRRRAVEALAELALDSVAYELADRPARIAQVELEARSEAADLAALAAALSPSFPELVPWPYGKLATGLALEAALRDGTVTLAPDGWVRPNELDALARRL